MTIALFDRSLFEQPDILQSTHKRCPCGRIAWILCPSLAVENPYDCREHLFEEPGGEKFWGSENNGLWRFGTGEDQLDKLI